MVLGEECQREQDVAPAEEEPSGSRNFDAQGLLGKGTTSPKRLEEPGRCTLEWERVLSRALCSSRACVGCGGGEGQGLVAAMNAWPRCHPRAGA